MLFDGVSLCPLGFAFKDKGEVCRECTGCFIIISLCLAFLVALRYKLDVGMRYDFFWAPIICLCFAIFFATKPGMIVRIPFESIGKHSTNIWLTHSFFCYHWCQSIIYLPKWSPLVFLFLLGVSYLFSLVIDWSWDFALTWLHRINKDSCRN